MPLAANPAHVGVDHALHLAETLELSVVAKATARSRPTKMALVTHHPFGEVLGLLYNEVPRPRRLPETTVDLSKQTPMPGGTRAQVDEEKNEPGRFVKLISASQVGRPLYWIEEFWMERICATRAKVATQEAAWILNAMKAFDNLPEKDVSPIRILQPGQGMLLGREFKKTFP